jgi:hypothetical protein
LNRYFTKIRIIKFVGIIFLILTINCLLSVSEVMAHSPLIPGANENLADATLIPDPTKSWAIYGELHEVGETQYYRFNVSESQRIHIMLFKPTNPKNRKFEPWFALIGPGLVSQGNVPDYVEIPAGASAIVVAGEQPARATYEPFSASSFYSLAELDIPAPASGTYYIAVYGPSRGGSYGLAVGDRESYSLSEWILIPVKLISVYRWEGQSLAVIFLPVAATLAIGIGLMTWRKRWIEQTLFEWTAILAGLLFFGSGIALFFQMIMTLTRTHASTEIIITIILALLPVLLGIAVIRIIIKSREKVDIRKRAYLMILGVLALFAWAGLLIGPILEILAGVLPARTRIKLHKR